MRGFTTKVLTKGDGVVSPTKGDFAVVRSTIWPEGAAAPVFGVDKDATLPVGIGQNIIAVEEALLKMVAGEKVELICDSDSAYGEKGIAPYIQPQQRLCIHLELRDIVKA